MSCQPVNISVMKLVNRRLREVVKGNLWRIIGEALPAAAVRGGHLASHRHSAAKSSISGPIAQNINIAFTICFINSWAGWRGKCPLRKNARRDSPGHGQNVARRKNILPHQSSRPRGMRRRHLKRHLGNIILELVGVCHMAFALERLVFRMLCI